MHRKNRGIQQLIIAPHRLRYWKIIGTRNAAGFLSDQHLKFKKAIRYKTNRLKELNGSKEIKTILARGRTQCEEYSFSFSLSLFLGPFSLTFFVFHLAIPRSSSRLPAILLPRRRKCQSTPGTRCSRHQGRINNPALGAGVEEYPIQRIAIRTRYPRFPDAPSRLRERCVA